MNIPTLAPPAGTPHAVAVKSRRPRILLAIEGNIGIGKSTLMENLRRHFASSLLVTFVDEPVNLWESHGLLAAMYENRINRCVFQLMALSTRYAGLLQALSSDADLIIAERSIDSDRACFAEVNLDNPEDIAAYAASHDALKEALPKDLLASTILLEAPRATLHARIAHRGRAAEKNAQDAPLAQAEGEKANDQEDPGGVPEEYLERLDKAHEVLYARTHAAARRRVDATQTPDAVASAVLAAIDELCEAADALPPVVASSPVSIMDTDATMACV